MDETLEVIRNRRSVRSFQSEQISEADLNTILEAGVYAPSAMNQQKWHFTVVQNQEMIQRMVSTIRENILNSGMSPMAERVRNNPNFNPFYNAPTLIMVSVDEKARWGQFDCGLAVQNMALAAQSLNINSCIIAMSNFLFTSGDEFKKELGMPEGYGHVLTIALGYKQGETPSTPPRKHDVINIIR